MFLVIFHGYEKGYRDKRQLNKRVSMQGYPSGQREQTVNLPAQAYEGSSPSPCTTPFGDCAKHCVASFAGVAQLVEHQPSKLRAASSSLVPRSAAIAQLVERVLGKDEVTGSNPVSSSNLGNVLGVCF